MPYDFVAAVLVGGTEKLRGGDGYGVTLAGSVEGAIAEHDPEVVVDLSDEPVLGPRERLLLASRVLAAGLPYVGADFRFEPPAFEPYPLPALAVIGTGKRVGKTAVTTHVARVLARDRDVVVVAMGRGGPPEPEVVEVPPTVDDLLARSRAGRHAASDHLEIAALAGVPTVGCRRCAGGLAGATFVSNVLEGARVAAARSPDLVLFDGSGAAIPPVAVQARVLVAHDLESGLNPYRALISDLVLTMDDGVATAAAALGRRVIRFDLRLQPLEPLGGRRAAVFTTGPARVDHLEGVVLASQNLADREAATARSRAPRRRRLRGRAQGGRDRSRRRDRRLTRCRCGARPQRRRRSRPGRRTARARRAGNREQVARKSPAMTEPRHHDPLPLGGSGGLPYSRGLMARALMAAGVTAVRAYDLAQRVQTDLVARRQESVDLDRLEQLAHEVLGENEGAQVVRRLRRYELLRELDLPIILLIGGATGTGKSTVATEVAYRLGITRVTSTDFVRQTMRAFLSREFMPSIHYSSFEVPYEGDLGEIADGFVEQTRNVLIGVRAVIERALQEGWSVVLEGVHLVPGMLPPIEGALVMHCVLAIEDTELHESHFWVRDARSDGMRPVQKYLDSLGDIRLLQDFIVERARRTGMPVVENASIELTIGTVMELVLSGAERYAHV